MKKMTKFFALALLAGARSENPDQFFFWFHFPAAHAFTHGNLFIHCQMLHSSESYSTSVSTNSISSLSVPSTAASVFSSSSSYSPTV